MGFSDTADRAGILASMDNVLTFQALFFRHFGPPVEAHFGAKGAAAVTAALTRYGRWRGEHLAAQHREQGRPLSAVSLALAWDFGDWHCFGALGEGEIAGNPQRISVTTRRTPMWDYWRAQDLTLLAQRYYEAVYPALAAGYGAEVCLPAEGPDLVSPWTTIWTTPKQPAGVNHALRSGLLDRPAEAIEVLRWTSMCNGALYYFIADETTRRFDMAGEAVMRQSIRNLGLERAATQKAKHAAAGWPLDLVTLQNHWDGDFLSLWKFAEGVLTPGTWHQDCIACPYYDVWESFGKRGLALGYMYDYELHPTYYREYHPDCVVQFEGIRTRGDEACKFRVSIPSLQEPGEPAFKGYCGKDI
jgi:hypothetical protein